jgi:hypothetical protein
MRSRCRLVTVLVTKGVALAAIPGLQIEMRPDSPNFT